MSFWAIVGGGLCILIPVYVSNMLATMVGSGTPIDFGRNWRDGRRILGNGKSWRGLIVAPLLTTTILAHPLHLWGNSQDWLTNFGGDYWYFLNVYLLGLGALVGDAGASFFKRRLDKPRGAPWPLVDQLDFIVGGYVVALIGTAIPAIFFGQPWWFVEATFLMAPFWFSFPLVHLIVTPPGHLGINVIAWWMGFKNEPW